MTMGAESDAVRAVAREGRHELASPYRSLPPFWRLVVVTLTVVGVCVAINQVFRLGLLGRVEFENAFIYAMFACYLSMVFLVFPAGKKSSKTRVPWYDAGLFLLTFIISAYFSYRAYDIAHNSWDFVPPLHAGVMAILLCCVTLEVLRRATGMGMFITSLIFALYPTVAGMMPGMFEGIELSVYKTAVFHALGRGSLLGIATSVFGDLLVGFMLFGTTLIITGGGKFFLDFALSLFGKYRGGPAKVSVVASAFFGSISGSAIANVVTTGSVTIPAMKKAGYAPYFAAAVEACASNGGTITPPIMGSVAFLMAAWLGLPYYQIMIAAAVPAILYFMVLFLQVDAYAARYGLKGIAKCDIPHAGRVLVHGWPFMLSFAILLYVIYLGREGQSPFVATACLLAMAWTLKRFRLRDFFGFFESAGQLLSMIMAIMAGVGFIIGSFDLTGVGPAFSSEMIMLAGGNMLLLVLLGAIANLILGAGLSITACYIFLAVVLAPALTRGGLNPVAVHLFIIYWAVASNLTPPVAFPAYTASVIAGASPNKTAWQAMKLGIAAYMVPFFFVARPGLVMQAPFIHALFPLCTTFFGLAVMACGLGGYLLKLGALSTVQQALCFISGLLFAIPEWRSSIAGGVLFGIVFLLPRRRYAGRMEEAGALRERNQGSA